MGFFDVRYNFPIYDLRISSKCALSLIFWLLYPVQGEYTANKLNVSNSSVIDRASPLTRAGMPKTTFTGATLLSTTMPAYPFPPLDSFDDHDIIT